MKLIAADNQRYDYSDVILKFYRFCGFIEAIWMGETSYLMIDKLKPEQIDHIQKEFNQALFWNQCSFDFRHYK